MAKKIEIISQFERKFSLQQYLMYWVSYEFFFETCTNAALVIYLLLASGQIGVLGKCENAYEFFIV